MKLQSLMLRNSLFLLTLILALPPFRAAAQTKPDSAPAAQAAAIPARITQAIAETQLVRLQGNVHPLARPEFDQGAVPSELPMQRMLLVLKRSVGQESALAQMLIDQQNSASANYHKWLTPEQFGAQFGPADADIQTVTSWLQSHGFQIAKVSKGKIAIEFSGTAAQVGQAFHTEIHKFVVNGETHFANASDPQIPAALTGVVRGPAPLNNFRARPAHHVAGEFTRSIGSTEVKSVKPEFTTSGGFYAIGPTDFATIYNVLPLWNTTPTAIDGSGQSIAVIGVSNINQQDITDFRTLFGLPTGGAANTPVVVIDGADPGILNTGLNAGAETEALLDVEWSGAVAKGAQIHLVIAADTDIIPGFYLAIFHVLDNNSDPILSLSFGDCEPNEGPNNTGLWQPLWEQAAAQGITVTVASDDVGSAGCENQMAPAPNPAKTGLQVSGFASTPFNVAVGGTDFNDAGTQTTYFNATNDPNTEASAKSYIPESTWNESCTNSFFGTNPEANCNSTLAANKAAVVTVGGGGGPSHCFTLTGTTCSGGYPKPAYQSFITVAQGMPNDSHRDLPDVSLFASSGFNNSFYAMCEADMVASPSCKKGQAFHFLGIGGTSASAPSFAGIMALVNQKMGQRQGNANFALYKLAQTQYAAATACNSLPMPSPPPAPACTFNDVITGTIAMPCTKGTMDCTTTGATDTLGVLNGFSATPGYDLATGLGSVNANNLVNNWSTALAAFTSTSTTLSLSPLTGITAGQSVTVNVMVTPGSGTAKPTGDVALVSNAMTGDGVDGFTLDASGAVVNGMTTQLTGGTYQVTARYGGDGTFAPSVSVPVMVTVGKASSTTTGSVLVSIGGTNYTTFTSGQAPVTLFLKSGISPTVVANNSPLTPTGTVNFVDTFNGTPTTVASNVAVNSLSEAFTIPGISTFGVGNHSIVANYSGDASFNASSSTAVIFTITAASPPSITSLTPTSGPVGTSVTIAGANFGATQGTSTITFNGTTATPTSSNWSAASIVVPVPAGATTGNVVVTVGGVASNGVAFTVTSGGSFTVSGAATPVTAGASGNSMITVTPTGGFAGTVAITCGTTLPGVSCTSLNVTVPSGGGNGTGQLAINIAAPAAQNAMASLTPAERRLYTAGLIPTGGGQGWWTLSGIAGLAAIILVLLPGRKRFHAALGLGLICVLSFTLGCGGYSGSGGGGGPVPTTTHITVTSATRAAAGGTFTFTATVTGGTPTNQVQLYDGATATGTAVAVSGGTAALTTSALSTVGMHSITARYAGDATYTQASSSGALNVMVTGTTQLPITGTSGSTTASGNVSLTIN